MKYVTMEVATTMAAPRISAAFSRSLITELLTGIEAAKS